MKGLLRKLVDDLPTLEEYTLVPLKMMTLWYDKCGKYYSSHSAGVQASEEEKKLTMTLFTKIFDALGKRVTTAFVLNTLFQLVQRLYLSSPTIQSCLAKRCLVCRRLEAPCRRITRIWCLPRKSRSIRRKNWPRSSIAMSHPKCARHLSLSPSTHSSEFKKPSKQSF